MKRLFIYDPSLTDLQGHHFTLTLNATRSAEALGFCVTWLCSTAFRKDDQTDLSGIEVKPVLGQSMYDAYRQAGSKNVAPTAASVRDTLRDVIITCEMGSDDRILFHTADGVTYTGIELLLEEMPTNQCPVMHICTPYDPVGIMPNRESATEISNAIARMKERGLIESKIFLYGENKYLARHLATLWEAPVEPLNLPVALHPRPSTASLYQFRREQLGIAPEVFLCTYLGSARLEKGYQKLPYIVGRTLQLCEKKPFEHIEESDFHFALQSSKQIVGYHPDIEVAIDRIIDIPTNNVTLFKENLSNGFYDNLLYTSDAIILPYEAQQYRFRGSGIVSEAINAGKFLIATKNSYPGKMAEKSGGASATRPIEFAKEILKAISHRDEIKKRVEKSMHDYHRENTVLGYWKKCLDRETSAAT